MSEQNLESTVQAYIKAYYDQCAKVKVLERKNARLQKKVDDLTAQLKQVSEFAVGGKW
jgi:phage shock protein A